MVICLDCGSELQILKLDIGFQLVEVTHQNDGLRKPKLRKIGRIHKTLQGVLDEVNYFALEEYEALALTEVKDVITGTCDKTKEWFGLHSDYLAHLEQPNF
ncbi:hypothetical protein [Caviibacterium pharyngocola]|uniref:Uncharacterized protein n=1 Tax=Caviibacterium pharyngocola TaxID=28159 RepID=A0A2M8RTD5_9PAST|nr:hypothetical protein [Caviibacterium pharyngocola]PJG82153.1 hypothetical protein CVP04_10885 [Caviibacterium pharyngocola]